MKQLNLITIFILLFKISSSQTIPNVDSSFAINGYINTHTGNFPYSNSFAIQSDKKIIVAYINLDSTGYKNKIQIIRYFKDGGVDSSFGNYGSTFILPDTPNHFANSVILPKIAILNDDNIIVEDKNGTYFKKIFKLNANGIFDSTFLNNSSSIGLYNFKYLFNILITTDNKILYVGYTNSGISILKTNANGIIDSTFGTNGIAIIDTSLNYLRLNFESYFISDAKLKSNGNIVVAGQYKTSTITGFKNMFITEFTSNGFTNLIFGNNGATTLSFNHFNMINAIDIQSDNKMIAVGTIYDTIAVCYSGASCSKNNEGVVLRLTDNGNLDTTFNSSGFHRIFNDSLVIEYNNVHIVNNKIIVFARFQSLLMNTFWQINKFNMDGKFDVNFSNQGSYLIVDTNNINMSYSSVMQYPNKILCLGFNTKYLYTSTAPEGSMIGRFIIDTDLPANIKNKIPIYSYLIIYPNPTKDYSVVKYSLLKSQKINIALYDFLGNKIKQIVSNEFINVGEHEQKIDLENFSSGIYFLKFNTENSSQCLKINKE